MRHIPSSDFTRAPAKHLEAVFKGETITITRYGRPYVVLVPPDEVDTARQEEETAGQAR